VIISGKHCLVKRELLTQVKNLFFTRVIMGRLQFEANTKLIGRDQNKKWTYTHTALAWISDSGHFSDEVQERVSEQEQWCG
jgi:hypothetical protein